MLSLEGQGIQGSLQKAVARAHDQAMKKKWIERDGKWLDDSEVIPWMTQKLLPGA